MSYFIHDSSYADENVKIGGGTKIWHYCHIEKDAIIGRGCVLGQNVYIGKGVIIGEGCKIQNNVSVYSGVTLGDYVFCGPSCVFTNDLTPRAKYPKGSENFVKTFIGNNVSIGANATIVCGHNVGKCAMIGAGAVVTADVKDYMLMLGVPARFAGWVCECGERLNTTLICKKCGKSYFEKNNTIHCNGE